MITLSKSREVSATIDEVWNMISNVDNEQRYWPQLKNVKILNRKGNRIEREATVTRGPIGDAKSLQTLILNPKKSTILTMTKGPMLGTRKVALEVSNEHGVKVDVIWEFELRGVPEFAQGFVKDSISEATDKALTMITEEAEHLALSK